MRLLLDTHAWLWFVEGDEKLSTRARELIQNTDNQVFVSRVSFFEAAIKYKIGKLMLTKPLRAILLDTYRSGIEALDLTDVHISQYEMVPFAESHRDPFDRMLLTIALHEGMVLVTRDEKLASYREFIPIVW
jgi:PIN domain nuclease of toxin-antitoxin system